MLKYFSIPIILTKNLNIGNDDGKSTLRDKRTTFPVSRWTEKGDMKEMAVWEPLFAHLPMKLAGTTLTRRWASIPRSALKTSLTLPRCTVVRTESTFLHRIWYNSDNLSPKCACALLIEAVAGALRSVSTISLDFRFDHPFVIKKG